jgi:hypothetical protein
VSPARALEIFPKTVIYSIWNNFLPPGPVESVWRRGYHFVLLLLDRGSATPQTAHSQDALAAKGYSEVFTQTKGSCMKRVIWHFVFFAVFAALSGCVASSSTKVVEFVETLPEPVDKRAEPADKHAESTDKQNKPADKSAEPAKMTAVTMPPITYIVPSDNGVIRQPGVIEDLSFSIDETSFPDYQSTNRMISKSDRSILRDTSVFVRQEGKNLLIVQRKTYNEDGVGSGKFYRVDFSVEKNGSGYKVVLRPTGYETYQENLPSRFAVPNFDEERLIETLLGARIYYRFEIDSEFNSEAVRADFVRRLQRRPFHGVRADGLEKDRVNGEKFTEQFVLPYRDKEVLFTLEIFPYRNRSKAVMILEIPAVTTAQNTVDYRMIIDEIKAKLTEIVKS